MLDADKALAKLLADQPGAVSLLQHLSGGLVAAEGMNLEDELVHLVLRQFAKDVHAAIRRKLGSMKA